MPLLEGDIILTLTLEDIVKSLVNISLPIHFSCHNNNMLVSTCVNYEWDLDDLIHANRK